MVSSLFDGKYWWVVFEGVTYWHELETMEYVSGYPMYVRNTK